MTQLISKAASIYSGLVLMYMALRFTFGDRVWWLALVNTFAYLLFLPLLALLPLALLLGGRHSTLRLLPMAALGGLWASPYYRVQEPEPNTVHGPVLKVITANVWITNRTPERLLSWLRGSRADVILLQEITPEMARTLLPRLRDVYPHQSTQIKAEMWGHTYILSRYPIVAESILSLGEADENDALRVVLDVAGQQIAAYNIHLAWPGGKPRLSLPVSNLYLNLVLGYDDRPRNRQIDALLRHLAAEPLPYFVGGDFNTSDQSPTYETMAARMHDAYCAAGYGFRGSWPVSAARNIPAFVPPFIRIDYLWHSDDLRALAANIGADIGSDHLPVCATLELPPKAEQERDAAYAEYRTV